ncbi:E3 ubiquitin-protein ligase PUB24 [Sesamum angolense]|uniref:U-box domain-containing protein n=1 Tax=Sesamum angolense TaxID=2727404 RepID=A0AAE1XAL9_9LAMI|nr:E3 ubiquitin-protein ligase PUB24 [Sesamum angolense]
MDDIEIPRYFLCPISLQIMKDPVTTVTGITYDRESIEQWLATASPSENAVCPVTKQPLARTADLTPNHMLRRLIQAWCTTNALDRIPTPKSPLHRSILLKLIRELKKSDQRDSFLHVNALKKLDELAGETKNHQLMAEAGVPKAVALFVLRCVKEGRFLGLEEALRVLQRTWAPTSENKRLMEDNLDFVKAMWWVLGSDLENAVKTHAAVVLKSVLEVASLGLKERLEFDFFTQMVKLLRANMISQQGVRAVLHVLIETCPCGRNRTKIVEAGAVLDLIEMELCSPEKKTTELIFCLLALLCSCADGRQQLLKHAGGIAMVAKRLLRVSATVDDRALCIIESIARFSATREVVMEMLRVGAVSKLCMVLQADCAAYLKKKAREILRLHSNSWSNSPCIQVYLLTRYAR